MTQDRNKINHLGLYIHIPFCHGKCAYCAFYSLPGSKDIIDAYIQALCLETAYKGQNVKHIIDSIYIGGGTPSILSAAQIITLLSAIKTHFRISDKSEISLEVNPESVDRQKLEAYRGLGVNRISLGLQAWQDRLLADMKRPHTNRQFSKTYRLCRQIGFKNINIDTIFGYPNQTLSDWQETLHQIINLNPEHISCYSLEIDNHSRLAAQIKMGQVTPMNEIKDRLMNANAKKILSQAGYRQYEISNYSKPGYECRHNYYFWLHCSYMGLGAAAHGYFNGVHSYHEENIHSYIKKPQSEIYQQKLTILETKLEWLVLRLRLNSGFSKNEYLKEFKTNPDTDFGGAFRNLSSAGLLSFGRDTYYLTGKGFDLYNQVLNSLVSDSRGYLDRHR